MCLVLHALVLNVHVSKLNVPCSSHIIMLNVWMWKESYFGKIKWFIVAIVKVFNVNTKICCIWNMYSANMYLKLICLEIYMQLWRCHFNIVLRLFFAIQDQTVTVILYFYAVLRCVDLGMTIQLEIQSTRSQRYQSAACHRMVHEREIQWHKTWWHGSKLNWHLLFMM